MPIAFPDLPYPADALAPHISADTLKLHHGKHHKAYVDKLNKAIEGTDYAGLPLEEIVRKAREAGEKAIFENGEQAWNHGFYWHCLSPEGGVPSGALADAISTAFGSTEALLKQLKEAGEKHFGSGWAWLVAEGDTLKVIDTHDSGTPVSTGKSKPLLTIDVWEHAYYLDWKNERPKYLEAVTGTLLDWNFASENFARAGIWTYPAS
jgi:superoxide dismutase, Fe-Mn family